jgi:hypothetical protein
MFVVHAIGTQQPRVSPPTLEPVEASALDLCLARPIVIPLRFGERIKLSRPDVSFDVDGDGSLDTTSWPENPTDFAFLAIDQDGDGSVESGRELISERTVAGAADGFSALVTLYLRVSGVPKLSQVDRTSPLFDRLLLWQDLNRDGVSQRAELRRIREVLLAIGLGMGRNGSEAPFTRFTGWARYKDGKTHDVYDVCLATIGR